MFPVEDCATEGANIPTFCAAYMVCCFNGDEAEDSEDYVEPVPYSQLIGELKLHERQAVKYNKAMMVATLNENQEEAARALYDSGYTNTGWVHRVREHDKAVSLWIKHLGVNV